MTLAVTRPAGAAGVDGWEQPLLDAVAYGPAAGSTAGGYLQYKGSYSADVTRFANGSVIMTAFFPGPGLADLAYRDMEKYIRDGAVPLPCDATATLAVQGGSSGTFRCDGTAGNRLCCVYALRLRCALVFFLVLLLRLGYCKQCRGEEQG